MRGFEEFLRHRVEAGFSDRLTKQQIQQIANDLKKNRDRTISSETYKVRLATVRDN